MNDNWWVTGRPFRWLDFWALVVVVVLLIAGLVLTWLGLRWVLGGGLCGCG
jgi:hypothetical protein